MEYKKISINNTDINLVNTKRFKTIGITLFLYKDFNKDDIEYLNLLSKILIYSTKKYNTKNKFNTETEELYNINFISRVTCISNIEVFALTIEFINPSYTEALMYKKSINLFKEVIFNPNVVDNSFEEDTFNLIKRNIIYALRSKKDNTQKYAYDRYKEIMFEGLPNSYSLSGKEENYDKINSKNLYSFYKKIFTSFNLSLSVVGNIDEDILLNSLKPFINKFSKIKVPINFQLPSTDKKFIKKEEETSFNQSHLLIGYDFSPLTFFETKYCLSLYNIILGSMGNSVLFNIVREKYSLCYSIGSSFTSYNPSITILSSISSASYEKAIDAINESLSIMSDTDKIKDLLSSAKKTSSIYINNIYDDYFALGEFYFLKNITKMDDLEVRKKLYDSVTTQDIVNINKKMKQKVIYFLRGK
ncbi:MAG: insulinase family protein [Bacilli bacterium]